MGGGAGTPTPAPLPLDQRSPLEALRLALRQCMTHPAGPLSTLARLADDVDEGRLDVASLQALRCEVSTWLGEQDMTPEREHKARQFLAVVFDGKLVSG